jgi:hypothetical protein
MSRKMTRRLLDLTTSPLLVTFAGICAIASLFVTEDDLASTTFAAIVIVTVIGLVFVISRRLAFSAYAALTFTLIVVASSIVKARLTGTTLHALDLAHLADPRVLSFLVTGYASYILPILVALVLAVVLLSMIYRHETPRQGGLAKRLILVVVPGLLLPIALPQWASRDDYHVSGKHASAFAASLRELPHLWDEHPLMARLKETPSLPPYEVPLTCASSTAALPDVLLVHAESQLPPRDIPSWGTGMLSNSFMSGDGKIRSFGVETYGGSSWITVSSVMSGLSGADFDWMRQFISTSMTGKIDDAVPAVLAACGFDTTGVLTFGYKQFDLGPFFSSIGVEKVAGAEETGIPVQGERDFRYYRAALDALRSGKKGNRPQFVYVETMFTHSPYNTRYEPATVFEDEPFHSDSDTAEFLRRLVIAREDLEALREELERNPGPRGTILVEYGDHRPLVAPVVLREDGKGGLADWSSQNYQTYFAVHAYGSFVFPTVPDYPRLDAAYLGYWIVEATGAATGGIVSDMKALRHICGGLFHTCPDRAAVDRVLRRRLDAGNVRFDPLMQLSF